MGDRLPAAVGRSGTEHKRRREGPCTPGASRLSQPPLATVEAAQSLDEVFATLTGGTNAVVVASGGRPVGVLTRSDLLEYLAHRRDM